MDELRVSKFRATSRGWAVCGSFTALLFITGCDPCMNNPCDDGLACNGLETCSADGGEIVCTDGTPVTCDDGTVCTEPDGACLGPCDGVDCDDGDRCTTDTCIPGDGDISSCTNVEIIPCPEEDDELVIDVLQLGDFFYPTSLFRCGGPEDPQDPSEACPQGAGCDEVHWHSDTVTAISPTTDATISDPAPCMCGHGKVSEVIRTTVAITVAERDAYLMGAGLDDLSAGAGDCP